MRSPRLRDAFLSLKDHAWFKRIYKRLGHTDICICLSFIDIYGELDHDQFDRKVSRMFLDDPAKPKRWQEMQELLANANSLINKKENA